MMCSMAAFTFNDTCIKAISGEVPLFQLLAIRGVLTSSLLFAMAYFWGALDFRMTRRDAVFLSLRSLSEIGAAYFIVSALWVMPLANITAILQVLPLTVTLGAALFFRETVGWRRMAAILVGFCGMLMIVRPGPDGFDAFALYGLMAVICVTMRDLTTRCISSAVPSLTVTFTVSLAVLVFFGFASMGEDWVPVPTDMWLLIIGSALFIMGGYLFSVMVMRVGEISFAAPFRYTGLLWALLMGWLFFDEWPDTLTLIGGIIVVGSGIFTLLRGGAKAS